MKLPLLMLACWGAGVALGFGLYTGVPGTGVLVRVSVVGTSGSTTTGGSGVVVVVGVGVGVGSGVTLGDGLGDGVDGVRVVAETGLV